MKEKGKTKMKFLKKKKRLDMKNTNEKGIDRVVSLLRRAASMWQLYVLLLPALIYIIVFNYIPMYGVQIAFKDYRVSKGIFGSEWVGFKHFIRFLTYPEFKSIMLNTMRISLKSLIWSFPLSVILALLLNELDNLKFKKFVQMVTYMPHFISTITVCGMVLLFFNRQFGVVNAIITALGGERVDFLGNPDYFDALYIGSGIWQGLGWGTIIYLSALSGVSPEMVEAAKIDGASRAQIIWYINIPTILPTIIIMLILSCGGILSVGFEKIYALQNPLNLMRSNVISVYTYQLGIGGGQFSYASAIGLFNTIINVTLLTIVNKTAKKVSDISII